MPRATSRRAMLAGLAAAPVLGLPVMAGEPHPDAAILAAEAPTLALIAEAKRLDAELTAAEELIEEMTRPVPQRPRDVQSFATDAAYADAMRGYEAHLATFRARIAQVHGRIGYDALVEAAESVDEAAVAACSALAEARATTLAGVAVKARIGSRWTGTKLYDSIAADLLAMGAAA